MSSTRIVGLLSLVAGASILAFFVITRVSADSLASFPFSRVSNTPDFITDPFRLSDVEYDLEFLIVVERTLPNEQRRSYPQPCLRILDQQGNVLVERTAPALAGRARPEGRSYLFTGGTLRTETAGPIAASATFAEDLVAPSGTRVRLELRKAVPPPGPAALLGGALLMTGLAVLLVTRPRRG